MSALADDDDGSEIFLVSDEEDGDDVAEEFSSSDEDEKDPYAIDESSSEESDDDEDLDIDDKPKKSKGGAKKKTAVVQQVAQGPQVEWIQIPGTNFSLYNVFFGWMNTLSGRFFVMMSPADQIRPFAPNLQQLGGGYDANMNLWGFNPMRSQDVIETMKGIVQGTIRPGQVTPTPAYQQPVAPATVSTTQSSLTSAYQQPAAPATAQVYQPPVAATTQLVNQYNPTPAASTPIPPAAQIVSQYTAPSYQYNAPAPAVAAQAVSQYNAPSSTTPRYQYNAPASVQQPQGSTTPIQAGYQVPTQYQQPPSTPQPGSLTPLLQPIQQSFSFQPQTQQFVTSQTMLTDPNTGLRQDPGESQERFQRRVRLYQQAVSQRIAPQHADVLARMRNAVDYDNTGYAVEAMAQLNRFLPRQN